MADRAYLVILRSRLAAQRQYPLSFALDVLGSVGIGLVEFAELWIIFHNVRALGGLTMPQMVLLFGLTHTGYAAAMVLFGHLDRIPNYVVSGTMEAFHLRPLSLLGQLVTSEFELRRIGWLAVGVAALGYGVSVNRVEWSVAQVILLLLTLASSTAIFGALFTAAGAVQFFLIDGAELTNAFSHGGRYASQQPTTILPLPLVILFTGVLPIAFTGYVPTLELLGLPPGTATPWLTGAGAWFAPVVATGFWAVTLLLWRTGTRHYQGGGG